MLLLAAAAVCVFIDYGDEETALLMNLRAHEWVRCRGQPIACVAKQQTTHNNNNRSTTRHRAFLFVVHGRSAD
jgi:hypothetical protein